LSSSFSFSVPSRTRTVLKKLGSDFAVSVATRCKQTARTVRELKIKTRNSSSSSYFPTGYCVLTNICPAGAGKSSKTHLDWQAELGWTNCTVWAAHSSLLSASDVTIGQGQLQSLAHWFVFACKKATLCLFRTRVFSFSRKKRENNRIMTRRVFDSSQHYDVDRQLTALFDWVSLLASFCQET
jgi:hypothetical protein